MKALTLYQPWASLMAIDVKRNETRPRSLAFKGDIAIHAGKMRWLNDVPTSAIPALQILWKHKDKFQGYFANIKDLYDALPFGKIVCVVEKFLCTQTWVTATTEEERICGDYGPGRFAYHTRNVRRLNPEISVRGAQGLFDLPEDVASLVSAQLAGIKIARGRVIAADLSNLTKIDPTFSCVMDPVPHYWPVKPFSKIIGEQTAKPDNFIITRTGRCKGCGREISKEATFCGECLCEEDSL